MPSNLYGPGDSFHPEKSHVLPALLRRFHEAAQNSSRQVTIWGTGTPRREFLHVDDMAEASLFVFDLHPDTYKTITQPMLSHINVGTGVDVTIAELASLIAEITGFRGSIVFDTQKPNGAARKLLDVSCLNDLGWKARIGLREGIAATYAWYLKMLANAGVTTEQELR